MEPEVYMASYDLCAVDRLVFKKGDPEPIIIVDVDGKQKPRVLSVARFETKELQFYGKKEQKYWRTHMVPLIELWRKANVS